MSLMHKLCWNLTVYAGRFRKGLLNFVCTLIESLNQIVSLRLSYFRKLKGHSRLNVDKDIQRIWYFSETFYNNFNVRTKQYDLLYSLQVQQTLFVGGFAPPVFAYSRNNFWSSICAQRRRSLGFSRLLVLAQAHGVITGFIYPPISMAT